MGRTLSDTIRTGSERGDGDSLSVGDLSANAASVAARRAGVLNASRAVITSVAYLALISSARVSLHSFVCSPTWLPLS